MPIARWMRWAALEERRQPLLLLFCLILTGLVAMFYLSQVAAVNAAGARLVALQAEQRALRQRDAAAHQRLAEATSPVTIDRLARAAGLVPGPAGGSLPVLLTPTPAGATR